MLRPRCAIPLALLSATLTSTLPRLSAASPTRTITSTEAITGDVTFDELIIAAGGVLQVLPYDAATMTGGALHIRANRIEVAEGGTITAGGTLSIATTTVSFAAGHPGADDADGGALATTTAGGKRSPTFGFPGGGGGYFGRGANGASDDCSPLADAFGGDALLAAAITFPLALGSAGGAANITETPTTAGARGGGAILLDAASIVLEGRVEAEGASSLAQGGVAPGAGSGGLIRIVASTLSGKGTISVAGGSGAHGVGDAAKAVLPNNGGGGSGGVIQIVTPSALAGALTLVIDGGATGDCITNTAEPGAVKLSFAPACADVDGDQHTSVQCGGDDCDDSDADISPSGGVERCDGRDNDCDGVIDDGDLCATGTACEAGACVALANPPAGNGADAGAAPDYITFQGGCSVAADVGSARSTSHLGGCVLPLAAAAIAFARRRRSLAPKAP